MSNITVAKWSVNDYHRLIASGILSDRQVELLAGEIIEMSPEGPLHTVYGEGLANYLRRRLTGEPGFEKRVPLLSLTRNLNLILLLSNYLGFNTVNIIPMSMIFFG